MLRMLPVALICGLVGCQTRTGADWDGNTTGATRVLFLAGYAQSVHIQPLDLNIALGQSGADVAALHEAAWNGAHPGGAFRCPSDPSIIIFPRNVGELVVIDEGFNIHKLGDGVTALPNGLTVRRHQGRCP